MQGTYCETGSSFLDRGTYYLGSKTNNAAEWEALIAGLTMAYKAGYYERLR